MLFWPPPPPPPLFPLSCAPPLFLSPRGQLVPYSRLPPRCVGHRLIHLCAWVAGPSQKRLARNSVLLCARRVLGTIHSGEEHQGQEPWREPRWPVLQTSTWPLSATSHHFGTRRVWRSSFRGECRPPNAALLSPSQPKHPPPGSFVNLTVPFQ